MNESTTWLHVETFFMILVQIFCINVYNFVNLIYFKAVNGSFAGCLVHQSKLRAGAKFYNFHTVVPVSFLRVVSIRHAGRHFVRWVTV